MSTHNIPFLIKKKEARTLFCRDKMKLAQLFPLKVHLFQGLARGRPGSTGFNICDRLWDFGPYGGTWAKLGFLYNLKCSSVLGILVNF